MADAPEGDFLVLSGVSKRYGGVRALENVDFACGRGRIHAVLGENGAGKSTLIKIVAGVVHPDAGSIALAGLPRRFSSPSAATAAGVVCIFQELSLMPDLSVADNISIAAPPRRFGLIDGRAQRRRAESLLAEVGCEDVNPLLCVRDLPLSRRQMVEIAKALGQKPKLLILDEATSALTSADVEKVYSLLARLKSEDVAILYITHRMHEVEALADRASVFRNGRHIETFDKGARSTAEIVQLMIGRDIATQYPPKPKRARPPAALKVDGLGWENRLEGISLEVGAGEIVGLGGLDGQGQKTLLLALFGVLRGVTGAITVNGRAVRPGSPGQAKAREIGVALVPEDRKTEGLMLPMSVADNLTIASLGALSFGPFIDPGKEADAVQAGVKRLRIKTGAASDAVSTLSGGNQQKVVIAKWLFRGSKVLICDEPTRGIDVGARAEIYDLLWNLAAEGRGVLFVSSDLPELIAISHRIIVFAKGRVVGEVSRAEFDQHRILSLAYEEFGLERSC
jgi:ribose transport system ATP-binding protein